MSVATKMCVVCGTDVSAAKRVKDSRGNYFCEKCYAAKLAEKQGKAGAGGGSPAGMIEKPVMMSAEKVGEKPVEKAVEKKEAGKAAPAVPLEAHNAHEAYDEYSVIPTAKPKEAVAASGNMLGCSVCKKVLPEETVKNIGGEFVCEGCLSKREVAQRAGLKGSMVVPAGSMKAAAAEKGKAAVVKPVVKAARGEEDSEHKEMWVHTLTGSLLICAAAVLGTWLVFAGMEVFWQQTTSKGDPMQEIGVLGHLVVGSFWWLGTMVTAGMLIVSMIVLDRMLGGVDFGFLGTAVGKAVMVSLLTTLLHFLSYRIEGFFWFMIMFGSTALLLTFMLVFRLDFFEASVLSTINFMLGWAAVIVFASLAASAQEYFMDDSMSFTPGPTHVSPRGGMGGAGGGFPGGGGAGTLPAGGVPEAGGDEGN